MAPTHVYPFLRAPFLPRLLLALFLFSMAATTLAAVPPYAQPIPSPSASPVARTSNLQPTSLQIPVLYVIVVYSVVLFGFWTIPIARRIISPLKLFAIGWHEACHAATAVLTGGTVLRMTIDPFLGGCTIVEGGYPPLILSAGYLGSTFFGAAFVLAGFDTLMAKIMSFIAGIGLIAPLSLVRDKMTIVLTVFYEALLIGFWFIDHAEALRWYMLFLGVLHIFFVVWDITDERFFRKPNDSDATQWALLCPGIPAHIWATFWILFEVATLIAFVLIGIVSFKRTPEQMQAEAGRFLPT
ncbi:peptidase M50B-like-domain-containing protein [Vararia minispora EC-137]|uniref:Peptidase M50B-like-domain-containing protein n=1 Tax=Vararia minispora EC-137 TaxID=1314806 RepID=A0ACB8Q7N5_9AGAM|nr:peptidase M50B-like-domain-containing protein [Vararia minispora EC-137]